MVIQFKQNQCLSLLCLFCASLSRKPLKVRFSSRPGENHVIPHDNIKMFRNDSGADNIMLVKLPEPVRNIVTAQLPAPSCTRPNIGEKLVGVNCKYSQYVSDRGEKLCLFYSTDLTVLKALMSAQVCRCQWWTKYTNHVLE